MKISDIHLTQQAMIFPKHHIFYKLYKQVSRLAVFLSFLSIISIESLAQTEQFRFERISYTGELAEANVLSICQDEKGFMWLGTSTGLLRYDGYELKAYRYQAGVENSLASDFIQSVTPGRDGKLWIATIGGGFSKFDLRKERFTNYTNNLSDGNSLIINDVNSVLEDAEGIVWVGTNEGLDRFDPTTNTYTHFVHSASDKASIGGNYVRKIFEDSRENIWIATREGGLNLYNRQTKKFTRFQNDPADQSTISHNDVYSIFEDSKGRIWVGTAENGLDLFNPANRSFTHFEAHLSSIYVAGTAISSIAEDRSSNIWIGTENGGITVFNPEKLLFTHLQHDPFDLKSISSNSINCLFLGSKGNMWVGTFNAGVALENADGASISHYRNIPGRNSLSNNSVLCFLEDKEGLIWIGTDGGGVNIFNPITGEFSFMKNSGRNNNSLAGDNILSLCEDRKGNIWIGTWGNGISVYNKKKKTFRHFRNEPLNPRSLSNNNAWTIYEDRQGVIWVGTYGGGVNRFNETTQDFTRYIRNPDPRSQELNDNWINSIFEGSDGKLYICTSGGGINILDRFTDKVTYMQPGEKGTTISHSSVNSIMEDEAGNFWIATGAGLNYLDNKTNKVTVYTTHDGLSGNLVYGLLKDNKGNLWISTDNGISSFNIKSKTFRTLGVADGLQSLRFKEKAYYISKTGELYFGGNNGFNRFSPEDLKTISFDPPIVLTSLKVDNRELRAADEKERSPLKENVTYASAVKLSYRSSVISFSFASLNYTAKEKKQYSYMLEGFDDEWQEAGGKNSVTYTNLDPGVYIFKVRGMTNAGEWSEKIASIRLIITPPFWLTWWFRSLVILIVLGTAFAIYFVRINAIKRQKQILEIKVQEQTAKLKLSGEQERQARMEADRANAQLERKNVELEQFVYIASHDLREPLRTTSGFADLLKRQYGEQLDEKAKTYINFITQSTERMRVLIADLLEFSRIGTEKNAQQVNVGDVVANVLADLGTAIAESNTMVTVGEMPVVNGYPTGIKQLFQNLIANAIKFRRKDASPLIRINAEKLPGEWRFSVSDNGIGIDEKYQAKIFMIFQRLHNRQEYEGSGIGLAHCKKIVEMHNGKIWVESKEGAGSTFFFTIPC